MSTGNAALVLHSLHVALLAHPGHGKSAVAKSWHKTAQSFSAIVHGPNHEGLAALAIVVIVCAVIYGLWQMRPSSK